MPRKPVQQPGRRYPTDDLRPRPHASLVLVPDPQAEPEVSFHGANCFAYPGRRDTHGMFVEIYHQVKDCNDTQIAFSRSKTHWHRPERRAVIPLGAPGSSDCCMARSDGCSTA